MSRQTKKRSTTISVHIKNLSRKLKVAKPSVFPLSIVIMAVAIFLFGGGLYSVITKPLPAVYYGGRFYFLYPELGEQFITDSIVSMILYSMGIGGLVIIYQSTKFAYRPRQAYMMFIAGIVLLLLAYLFVEVLVQSKLQG